MTTNVKRGAKTEPDILYFQIRLREGDFRRLLLLAGGIHSILKVEGPKIQEKREGKQTARKQVQTQMQTT